MSREKRNRIDADRSELCSYVRWLISKFAFRNINKTDTTLTLPVGVEKQAVCVPVMLVHQSIYMYMDDPGVL